MALPANWNYPTAIRFGAGRIAELGDACARGGDRAAAASSPTRASCRCRSPREALGVLAAAGLAAAVFSEVQPNPTEANVAAGLAVMRDGRPRRGRRLRRRLGARLRQGRRLHARARPGRCGTSRTSATGGRAPTPPGIAPIVAVPTTAGTGSEVGRAGVITNLATHTKKVIFHPKMLPAQVICDPELTVRAAAGADRGHRHGRARALPRGLCRARLPPDGRGDRGRGHAALQGHTCRAPTATGTTSRRGRNMLVGGGDGGDGVPEGARRHPCAVAPGRGALRHPPRADQRGLHALRARLQPRGALGQDRPARRPGSASRAASPGFSTSSCACAATSASRTRSTGSASTTAASRRWRRWRWSIRPPAATRGT